MDSEVCNPDCGPDIGPGPVGPIGPLGPVGAMGPLAPGTVGLIGALRAQLLGLNKIAPRQHRCSRGKIEVPRDQQKYKCNRTNVQIQSEYTNGNKIIH